MNGLYLRLAVVLQRAELRLSRRWVARFAAVFDKGERCF